MASFGGWAKFGGSCKFGGRAPFWQRAYRILSTPPIAPPGLWPQDDTKLINIVLRAEARAVGHGLDQLEALAREIFPQTAHDSLEDWEELLNLIVSAGASYGARQAACQAKSRGNQGVSLPELRSALYPVLESETAMEFDFDGTTISSRFDKEGNGTRTIATSYATLTVTSPTDGDWLAENANRCTHRIPDITDGWTWRAKMASATIGTDTATGIVAMGDVDNAVMLVAGNAGGTSKVRLDTVVEGTLTVGVADVAIPSYPYYLQISRDKATHQITLSYGADPAALSTLTTIDQPVATLRRVGFFARNLTASTNTVSGAFDELKLVHETAKNNVEIIEQREANCDLAGDATLIFEAFICRRPGDSGSYDIAQAQRICDSVKLGHTLLGVGESCEFACDDPYSLCDRDILGE